MGDFQKAEKRKQKFREVKEIQRLQQRVVDLKIELAEGKTPLKQKIEVLELQLEEEKQEVRHLNLMLHTKEEQVGSTSSEIIDLKKEVIELYKLLPKDTYDKLKKISEEEKLVGIKAIEALRRSEK